jgi:hypothetical protein
MRDSGLVAHGSTEAEGQADVDGSDTDGYVHVHAQGIEDRSMMTDSARSYCDAGRNHRDVMLPSTQQDVLTNDYHDGE